MMMMIGCHLIAPNCYGAIQTTALVKGLSSRDCVVSVVGVVGGGVQAFGITMPDNLLYEKE